MKRQKNQFLKSLAALPSLDFFLEGDDPAGGGASIASPFDITDFQLFSSSQLNPGVIFDYTELHLDSIADGGTMPIKSQDDPERVMFVGGLPPVGANWSMSIVFMQGDFTDTIAMSRVTGKFAMFRLQLGADFPVIFEAPSQFFTIQIGPKEFETYVNTNNVNETALLKHTKLDTFDKFGLSILGRSN